MDAPNLSRPPLSIVIRSLNVASTLPRVLAAFDRSPEDELILVDSGSTDATLEIARQAGAKIVTMKSSDFTYGRSLNLGFRAARHEWVLALSAHAVPTRRDFLDLYREGITRRFPSHVSAAVGPMLLSDLDRPLPGGVTIFEASDFKYGFGFGAGNPNSLYRRSDWEEMPFDEETGGGEDLEWYVHSMRQGKAVAAVHAAAVYYVSRQPMKAFYRKGRVDFRASARWIEPHTPSIPGLIIRIAKLVLYAALGRTDWQGAKSSIAHGLGNYVEARALRRAATAQESAPTR
jgi:rhamnosyltransferase